MPVKPINLDTGIVGPQRVVEDGATMNGMTISNVPTGLEYFVKFGNNKRVGPFDDRMTFDFGARVDRADVSEGVDIEIDNAVPTGRLIGFVSYTPSNPTIADGGAVSAQQY
jgi:hypothetical protein